MNMYILILCMEIDLRYSEHLSEGPPALREVRRALQSSGRLTNTGCLTMSLMIGVASANILINTNILSFDQFFALVRSLYLLTLL